MESQVSLTDLKKQFKEIVGFRAPAPISEEGAINSSGVIIEVEEKFLEKKMDPSDILRAVIATSQLLQWCEQENREVGMGAKQKPGNPLRKEEIVSEFEKGGHSKDELKQLSRELYVVDPALGASKSMQLLTTLHKNYPDIPLKQDISSS